jgi:ATP-binding cassette subfamily F protein 3
MSQNAVIIRFENVSFEYNEKKQTLEEANFSVREHAKITIMGQNGAGKSTLFKLITGELKPNKGTVHIAKDATIAVAHQVMKDEYLNLTVEEFFATAFTEKPYNLKKLAEDALAVVNYSLPFDRYVKELSGGQQARLLLAHALIQQPDILLLDEPTNNLDDDGIGYLTAFLMMYDKTVIVISHDATFLNSFTDGVLHLDVYTHKVEQYHGNYDDVVEKMKAQIEKEERKNAQLRKNIQDRKDKINFFSHKGGKMRKLASKMRDEVEEDEENMVDVKREDETITAFRIPAQHMTTPVVTISSVTIIKDHIAIEKPRSLELRKGDRLCLKGPNGIGKSTLLKRLADRSAPGAVIHPDAKIGYYKQDFSGLDFSMSGFDALQEVMEIGDKERIYATGASFLLKASLLHNPIGTYSEGQKALLTFARFVLQEPALLILDEPTNHVNFRHLPVIAQALNDYEGTMILVSHMQEFVDQIHCNMELDLGKMAAS